MEVPLGRTASSREKTTGYLKPVVEPGTIKAPPLKSVACDNLIKTFSN